jgi:hypothetical protein
VQVPAGMHRLLFLVLAACVTAPPRPSSPPRPPEPREEKSMALAYARATVATVAGLGMVAAGGGVSVLGAGFLTFGPALGEIYADAHGVAFLTSVTRFSAAAMVVTEELSTTSCYDDVTMMDGPCTMSTRSKVAIGFGVAATLFDLVYTGFAVERYNERARATQLQIVPTPSGVAIGASF